MNTNTDWTNPFLLEQKVAHMISQQAKHGCNFNMRDARWHVFSLTEKITRIDAVLVPLLPAMMVKGSEYMKPFKMNGSPKAFVQKYMDKVGLTNEEVVGAFTAIQFVPFDTGKTAKVKALMLDNGWIPTEWNSKQMPFNVWSYRKTLDRMSYAKFINSECDEEEGEFYEACVNDFIQKHFVKKSKGYMRAILIGMGFDVSKKVPTFDQIKKKLLLNPYWITSPKITEDSFDSIDETQGEMMRLLKERMVWSHRRSLIQGLIELVRDDGKIAGEANPCATPTARMRHRGIVNIPAAGSPYGEQCRNLFVGNYNGSTRRSVVVRLTKEKLESGNFRRKPGTNVMEELDKGKWVRHGVCVNYLPAGHDMFVGGDGAGLELRMLAHYLIAVPKMLLSSKDFKQFTKAQLEAALVSAQQYMEVLLNGDIHTHNQRLAGLPTRKSAKTFIYAFLYGAGDANLGAQLGGDKELGAKARETFMRECPCIPVLIEWVRGFASENGFVVAIDGRKLIMRKDDNGKPMVHKALNTLLQAAGSIVMKYAGCFLDNWNKKQGLRCHQVIMMHDEYQFSCHPEDVDALRANIDKCVAAAGVYLKMECVLASDSIAGSSWLYTH